MRGAGLLVVLIAAGCGGTAIDPGRAAVALGTSGLDGSGFYALQGDQPLVPGAQGGFHVWVKYRMTQMASGKLHLRRTARRVSDGELILQTEHAETVGEPNDEGFWE